jgi:glycosyltransferase involved in cell wall biosynthesis
LANENEIQVSVVVPCRNEIRFIRVFLESVIHQDFSRIRAEVLIADGMSEDGTRDVLAEYERRCPMLRVIDNPQKIAATGLNAAIRTARGDVIVRMDAHSQYAPDYVQSCFDTLNETDAANVGGPALTRADGYLPQAIALAYGSRFARGGAKSHDPAYEGYVDTVTYGCWRKSTLERVGMFDERFYRSQDNELNRRIIAAGEKIWQSPKIVSWYRPRCGLLPLFHQYFQYGFWKVAILRKHGKPASWRQLIPGASLIIAAALLLGATGAAFAGPASWRTAFEIAFASFAGLYCAAAVCAAFLLSRRDGWRFFPALPIIFATYHLSFGLGFLLGLTYRPAAWDHPSQLREVLKVITR